MLLWVRLQCEALQPHPKKHWKERSEEDARGKKATFEMPNRYRAFCCTRFSRRARRALSKKGGCWPGRCAARPAPTLLGERPTGATLSGMKGKTGTLESPANRYNKYCQQGVTGVQSARKISSNQQEEGG